MDWSKYVSALGTDACVAIDFFIYIHIYSKLRNPNES